MLFLLLAIDRESPEMDVTSDCFLDSLYERKPSESM